MTEMISGKAIGANHDPRPWLHLYNGVASERTKHRSPWPRLTKECPFCDPKYDPRAEYDVPVNPVLAFFREEADRYGDPAHGNYEIWLAPYAELLGRVALYGKVLTPEHIDHARRVLTKLAALR